MQKMIGAFMLATLGLWGVRSNADDHSLVGIYDLDASRSDDIQGAIRAGTAEMNFAIRGIARDRTAAINPRYATIAIAHESKEVIVTFSAHEPLHVSLDGPSTDWIREDGGHWMASAQWNDSKLIMHMVNDNGRRTNIFDLSPDGQVMSLHVEITSPHLSGPIRYTLAYKRHDQ
jgi:hypothetical protein